MQLAAKIDPELIRQIDDGGGDVATSTHPIEAVFRLHSADPSIPSMDPQKTAELAHEILKRVQHRTGIEPARVNVFRNLGSFVVAADPAFLTELMAEPEIASAMANRQSTPAFIAPINKRPASISQIGTEDGGLERMKKKPAKPKKAAKSK